MSSGAGSKRGREDESFRCALCLDSLMSPVTASCGSGEHAFCRSCLIDHITGPTGPYCPSCCKPVQRSASECVVNAGLAETIRLRDSAARLQAAIAHGFQPALAATATGTSAAEATGEALFQAGLARRFGLGIPHDLTGAAAFFAAAAAPPHEHAGASSHLAHMLLHGIGAAHDRLAALRLMEVSSPRV